MENTQEPLTEKQDAQMNDSRWKPSYSDGISRLDHVFTCLSSKNDTQRFVGLTLLMSYLEGIQGDYGLISKCWAAIPDTFITRLLRARFREDTVRYEINAEDQTKFELGLTALHSFASLLPQEYLQVMLPTDMPVKVREGWRLRIEALMVEVPYSSQTTRLEIFQVLLSIATTSAGSKLLYKSSVLQCWTPLLAEVSRQPLVLEIVSRSYLTIRATKYPGESINLKDMLKKLEPLLCIILDNFGPKALPARDLFDWFHGLLISLHYSSRPNTTALFYPKPFTWMEKMVKLIHIDIVGYGRVAAGHQTHGAALARLILHIFPQFSVVLFDASTLSSSDRHLPMSYIFTNFMLIDIRSTIPSLQEILNTQEYANTSLRLAASYDLVFAHLEYVLQAEDDSMDEHGQSYVKDKAPANLPFDLVLELRDAIAETMRLTAEFVRDMYDVLARSDATLKTLAEDPLVTSQIGALCFWINNDDAALMDDILEVILRLYCCKTGISPLCLSCFEGMVRERKDLKRKAQELVEGMSGVEKEEKSELLRVISE